MYYDEQKKSGRNEWGRSHDDVRWRRVVVYMNTSWRVEKEQKIKKNKDEARKSNSWRIAQQTKAKKKKNKAKKNVYQKYGGHPEHRGTQKPRMFSDDLAKCACSL